MECLASLISIPLEPSQTIPVPSTTTTFVDSNCKKPTIGEPLARRETEPVGGNQAKTGGALLEEPIVRELRSSSNVEIQVTGNVETDLLEDLLASGDAFSTPALNTSSNTSAEARRDGDILEQLLVAGGTGFSRAANNSTIIAGVSVIRIPGQGLRDDDDLLEELLSM